MLPRCLVFAAVAVLGFSSFSSATAFGSTGQRRQQQQRSILANNRQQTLLPRFGLSSRSALSMIPRGGELEDNAGNIDDQKTVTATTEEESRSPFRFATVLSQSPVSVLRPVTSLYCAALAKHPITTNCATAAVLSVTSDAIAQRLERRANPDAGKHHDVSRTSWMALWGWIISGLLIHYWFIFLNGLFPVEGLTLIGALKKVGVNQLVMSPGLNALFFAFTTYTRGDVGSGQKLAFLKRKLAADLIPTMKRSCLYWGTIQLVNFLLIPSRFAILYTNVGFLLWTTYISLVGYRTVASDQ